MEEDEADVFLDSQEAVVRMEFWQVGFFDRAMCRLCCTPRCGVLVRSVSKERLYLRARRLLFLLPCEIGSRAVSSSHRARGLLSGGHSGQTRVAVNESVKVSVLPHCSTQHCVVTACDSILSFCLRASGKFRASFCACLVYPESCQQKVWEEWESNPGPPGFRLNPSIFTIAFPARRH
eukprot:1159846-Pelagomonas_calceolata.AAC.4